MSETMKAAIFVEPGKMTVEEVPKAMLEQDDDIVIRVVRTCVCGSDLWFFRGLSGQAAHSQVGHESIGVVEEVGGRSNPSSPAISWLCHSHTAAASARYARPASNPCARTAATSPPVRPNTCVCPRRTAPWSRCPVHRKIIPMNSSHRC